MKDKMKKTKTERLLTWHKLHPKWSNAAIARMFHCSREWVRFVIERDRKTTNPEAVMARALELARENQNSQDSLH